MEKTNQNINTLQMIKTLSSVLKKKPKQVTIFLCEQEKMKNVKLLLQSSVVDLTLFICLCDSYREGGASEG